jgi:hypothetical protein
MSLHGYQQLLFLGVGREVQHGVKRIDFEKIVMRAGRRAGAPVMLFVEIIFTLIARNGIFVQMIRHRNIPYDPMDERAWKRIGVV